MTANPEETSAESPKEKGTKKTPKWLKALEAQSWQAELLISGLLVAGLLQVPMFFVNWMEGYIFESTEMGFHFLSFASLMIVAGANCLVTFFGFHFLFRGIWVALLGLNSVYPDGIDVHSTQGAGPKYWQKAKKKYPSLSAYNVELDKICSLIFSMATVTIIMLASFCILILLAYLVFRFLVSYYPILEDYIGHIGIGIYFLLSFLPMIFQQLAKRYPDNKTFEKINQGYGVFAENVFSLYFFKKPIGYIINIYTSNIKSKKFMIVLLISSFFLGLFGASQTDNNPVYRYFKGDRYYKFNNQAHRSFPFNYDNLRAPGSLIFTPSISSDVIEGEVLKLFIPTVYREKEQMNLTELNLLQKIKTDRSVRDSIHEANLQAYVDFNKVFVNNKAYPNLDFQYYIHPNANEEGIITYLPTTAFKKGKNVLEVRKQFFSKKGAQKIVAIPFYFSGS